MTLVHKAKPLSGGVKNKTLFTVGDYCVINTGKWLSSGYASLSTSALTVINVSATSLSATSETKEGRCYTNNYIDLTEYKTLKVKCETTGSGSYYLYLVGTDGNITQLTHTVDNNGYCVVDISAYEGAYQIGVYAYRWYANWAYKVTASYVEILR